MLSSGFCTLGGKVKILWLLWVLAATFLLSGGEAVLARDPLHIYLDADRTGARNSGLAIEMGVRTALEQAGGQLANQPVKIIIKNHRGNSRRSLMHLKQFLADPNAICIIAGLHSPPLLANREFINKNHIPVLVPWAAAGPITRYPSKQNWIFRLSLDDTKAGFVIASYAIKKRHFKKPYLLLENTGWGRSNFKTMTLALKELGLAPPPVTWFNWGVKPVGARHILRSIAASGADVIFLVSNAPEGKVFAQAMLAIDSGQRLPICSHWGITGGDFPEVITASMRKELDLTFIQTRFSFLGNPGPFATGVFNSTRSLFPERIKNAADIKAPAGFIHAFDLTKLLIAAAARAGFTGDIVKDRGQLRRALENLTEPIQGLIKTYNRPFTSFSSTNPDAHEALGIQDFIMAKYGPDGEVLLIP